MSASFDATLTIDANSFHTLDSRVFGQFLEIPHWEGENGVESAWNKSTQSLHPEVLERFKRLNPRIIRFPGGTATDHLDWTRFIDAAPNRAPSEGRPIMHLGQAGELGHNFGYKEFLNLCEENGWDAILPVNFLDAIARRKSPQEAALYAAGQVAYANASQGAALPDGMPDWPSIRAKSGRSKPWKVKLWQIGNEWFVDGFKKGAVQAVGSEDPVALAAWYKECLLAYIHAMLDVDPDIEFIIDAQIHHDIEPILLADSEIRRFVKYTAIHRYNPWGIRKLFRDNVEIPRTSATTEDIWRTFVSMPGKPDANGQMTWDCEPAGSMAHALGYKLVCTEWNWNGWWAQLPDAPTPDFDLAPAAGLGAASYLHGLIRDPRVAFANQSMSVGRVWGITAIRYDYLKPEIPPGYNAQAIGPLLYANHHGERVLSAKLEGAPLYNMPLGWESFGPNAPHPTPYSTLDVAVSASEQKLYLHMVNRDSSRSASMEIRGLPFIPKSVEYFRWQAPKPGYPYQGDLALESSPAAPYQSAQPIMIPPRSVNVVVLSK